MNNRRLFCFGINSFFASFQNYIFYTLLNMTSVTPRYITIDCTTAAASPSHVHVHHRIIQYPGNMNTHRNAYLIDKTQSDPRYKCILISQMYLYI